jgi:hypothetical protein
VCDTEYKRRKTALSYVEKRVERRTTWSWDEGRRRGEEGSRASSTSRLTESGIDIIQYNMDHTLDGVRREEEGDASRVT